MSRSGLHAGPGKAEKALTHFFVWAPFLVAIWGVFYWWNRGIDATSLSLFIVFVFVSGFGVTAGFHRLFTHASYKTYRWTQITLAICGSMSGQNSFFRWVADHSVHHQYSDQIGDPHSPHLHGDGWNGFWLGFYHAHMGWFSQPRHSKEDQYTKHLSRDPALVFVNKYFVLWFVLGLLLPGLIGGLISWSWKGALFGFLWGGMIRLFIVYHITWSINSICHIWGIRRFDTDDHSVNNPILAIIGFGEGNHNNHHAIQNSARHGISWWEIDPTWYLIWTLAQLRLVWDVKVPRFDSEGKPHIETIFKRKEKIVATQ